MKKIRLLSFIAFIFIGMGLSNSCQKNMGPPSITFVEGEGFVSQDTMLMVGDTITIGLVLDWNGQDKLKTLDVYSDDNLIRSYVIDFERGEYSFMFMKSPSEEEIWKFTLIDEKANQVSQIFRMQKDPNSIYGPIQSFGSLRMGAQNNVVTPGFFSFQGPALYQLELAFQNQEAIDLIYYYDETDLACLASPGANIPSAIFPGDEAPENWITKNTTTFVKTELTAEYFEDIFHDGMIIQHFSEEAAKRKAKNLVSGDVYIFKTESGLLGAFLVNNQEGTHDGELDISIKIAGE